MATAISGMLEGVGFWNDVRQLLERAKTRSDVFAANVGLALLTGAVGCSQAIAVVMTHSIMRITYAQRGIQDEDVMLDFENSGIVIAPLQPWNIAAYVPVVMMGTSTAGYVPFAPRSSYTSYRSFTGYDYGIKINQLYVNYKINQIYTNYKINQS